MTAVVLDDLESQLQSESVVNGEEGSNRSHSHGNNEEENTKEFTFTNYMKHPGTFIDKSYRKDSFKAFLIILSSIPSSKKVKTAYKFGLLIFFFVNFLYPIIVFIIEKENPTYSIVCSSISLVGLLYELCNTLIFSYIIPWYESRKSRRSRVAPASHSLAQNNTFEDPDNVSMSALEDSSVKDMINTNKEPKEAVVEFIRDTLGELFIYPSIICGLFGFINERGWEFDSALVIFDFILLLYSFLTDALNAKIIHIWHLAEVIKATYNKYDEMEELSDQNWITKLHRHFSPFSLALPYAVIQVLIHWLMLAIIGVRIYVDNFVRRINDTIEIEIGEYKTTPYTRYMIFCGAYLLIASTFVYLTLNKYWFFDIYHKISNELDHQIPMSVKLLAFMRDPIAYILVILQVVPFIPFAFGSFLPDYDGSEFEVASGIRIAAEVLAWCFIGLFVLSNMQAVIICVCLSIIFGVISAIVAIIAIVIAAILLGYVIIILCSCLAICCKDDGDTVSFSGIRDYTEIVGECCKKFAENFDADCIGDCIFENMDLCSCTCNPDNA